MRRVDVLVHQADRTLLRIRLQEALHHRSTQQASLHRVLDHGPRQGTQLERQIQQLTQEERDVPDLAVLENLRHLHPHLRLRCLVVHPLHEPEPRAQHPRKYPVARLKIPRSSPIRPQQLILLRPYLRQEVVHQTRLPHPRRAYHRHDAGLPTRAHPLKSLLELVHLRHTADQWRTKIARTESQPVHDLSHSLSRSRLMGATTSVAPPTPSALRWAPRPTTALPPRDALPSTGSPRRAGAPDGTGSPPSAP